MNNNYLLLSLFVALYALSTTGAFVATPKTAGCKDLTVFFMFGKLGDAFKNDDSLAPAKNAGLSNGPQYNEAVTVNGKVRRCRF